MKVSETKGESERPPRGYRCDFCQINQPDMTVNGGAWWICNLCFIDHYGGGEE